MKNILKLLCSFPIILILLYYLPFLGICLILVRYCLYKSKKYYIFPISLSIVGLLLLIPNFINKLNIKGIPYLNKIISSDIYIKIIPYSKKLITIGIIFLILSYIFKNVSTKLTEKLGNGIKDYIEKEEQKDYEIRQKNDLIMQEKREKAKNTHVVKCPHCGASNMLTEPTGTCKYCRKHLEYKQN